uniref:Uncharacterized protein n=1 Tax=Avena sativa TaxID=4498 RepID=A0ACD5WYG5_AVESA
MARREDDSAYTNGSVSMNDFSVEDGRKDKEVYADRQPADEDVVCGVPVSVTFLQMLLAELFSTFFLLFAGMAAIVVNNEKDGAVTFPGVTVVWGMAVMVMIYTVGHISGAHMNPAVTVGFAIAGRFPWRRVSTGVRAGADGGRANRELDAAADVRREARVRPGDAAHGLQHPVARD